MSDLFVFRIQPFPGGNIIFFNFQVLVVKVEMKDFYYKILRAHSFRLATLKLFRPKRTENLRLDLILAFRFRFITNENPILFLENVYLEKIGTYLYLR